MQQTTRYHLILICVLLISLVIIGSTSYYILHKHAREEVIKQADVLILDAPDYRHLAYQFGGNLVERVIKRGHLLGG